MKKKIHPKTQNVTVTCVCGNNFEAESTRKEIRVEICSNCHPFYTGKSKVVDTAGRVDRFKRIQEKTAKTSQVRKGKKVKRAKKADEKKADKPKTKK